MATARKTDVNENAFSAFFLPKSFDLSAVMDAQRKAVGAVVEANRVAIEGYRKASEKHVSNMQKVLDDASDVAVDMFNTKTPDMTAEKQVALVQDIASKGIASFREVVELTISANQDAFTIIQKSFSETVKDVKATTKTAA